MHNAENALCEYYSALHQYLPELQNLPTELAKLTLSYILDECINLIVRLMIIPPKHGMHTAIEQWWIKYSCKHQTKIDDKVVITRVEDREMILIGTNVLVPGGNGSSRLSHFWVGNVIKFLDLQYGKRLGQALWDSDYKQFLHLSTIERSTMDRIAEEITATFFAKLREATNSLT